MYSRVLGGLIAAHLLIVDPNQPFGKLKPSGYNDGLLNLAHDLIKRLLPAFNNTRTGVPWPRVVILDIYSFTYTSFVTFSILIHGFKIGMTCQLLMVMNIYIHNKMHFCSCDAQKYFLSLTALRVIHSSNQCVECGPSPVEKRGMGCHAPQYFQRCKKGDKN